MSFRVKLPFTRPKKEEKACTSCSFTTRNDVLFQRHINLCSSSTTTPAVPAKPASNAEKKAQRIAGRDPERSRQYSRNYLCEVSGCDFTTFKPRQFLQHKVQVHGEKLSIWQCSRCDYATKARHKLERHTRLVHHTTLDNAVAESVSTKSKRKSAVVTRIRRVSGGQQQRGIPTEVGEEPDESVAEEAAKEEDFVTSSLNGQENFLCKLCSYASTSREELSEHIEKSHSTLSQYKCSLCAFTTSDRQVYLTHRSTHVNNQNSQFHCMECDYVTEKKRNYERHMASHTKQDGTHKCFYCSFTSSTESAVHRHMGQYHKSKGPIALLITKKPGAANGVVKEDISKGQFAENRSSFPVNSAERIMPQLSPHFPMDVVEQTSENFEDDNFRSNSNNDSVSHNEDDEEEDEDDEPPAGPGELVCGECGYEARTMKSLLKHLDSHVNPDTSDVDRTHTPKKDVQEDSIVISSALSLKRPNEREDDGFMMKRPRESSEEAESIASLTNSVDSQPSLKCNYCSYIAKWPSDLRRHLKVHSVDRRFSCQFCGRMYKYQGDLNVHMKKAHTQEYNAMDKKEKVYTCPLCTYSTVSKKMYSSHFESHVGIEFECVYCEVKFQSYQTIKTHLEYQHAEDLSLETSPLEDIIDRCLDPDKSTTASRESTPALSDTLSVSSFTLPSTPTNVDPVMEKNQIAPGKWKCPKCSYLTHAQSKLRAHLTTHENIKPFQCHVCGKRSNWKWDVVKHMRSTHPGVEPKPPIELDVEEAKATIEDYLLNHPSAKKSWVPMPSPPSVPSPPKQSPAPSTPTSEVSFDLTSPIYRCSLCDFEDDHIVQLQLHSRDVHKGLARAVDLRKEQPPSKLYKCSECGQRSNWKADIRKHIRTKHGEGNADVVSCADSQKTTPVKQPEERVESSQTLIVESTWPFVCSLCAFKSNQKSEVMQHVSIHHKDGNAVVSLQSQFNKDVRPFKCPLCPRRSRWLWDLRKHMRNVHSGCTDEPLCQQYKCSLCTYISKWHTDIAQHLDLSHDSQGEVKVVMGVNSITEHVESGSSNRASPSPAPKSVVTPNNKVDPKEDGDGNKVWKCVLCNFTSSEKVDAMHHLVNTHPDDKFPYACKLCGHQFNFLSATYRHLRARHGKNDYALCQKNLVYVSYDDTSYSENESNETQELFCALCGYTSSRVQLLKHLMLKHQKTSSAACEQFIKSSPIQLYNNDDATRTTKAIEVEPTIDSPRPNMRYKCEFCPYQTNKIGMFKMHKSHHKFTPGNTYKCKFCSYYVCAARLLHQHVRLHLTNGTHYKVPTKTEVIADIPQEKLPHLQCQKCPHYAKSSRDLMYHKQFHRPKTTAPFKCNFCDYWVTIKNQLQQHIVVHDSDYGKPKPPTALSQPDVSVCNTITIDPHAVESAALKQHLIQSKIKSVTLRTSDSPESSEDMDVYMTQEHGDCAVGGVAFPSGEEVVVNGNHRNNAGTPNGSTTSSTSSNNNNYVGMMTIHRCQHCPYGNPRAQNVRLHEEMHGKRGENRYKCQHCDYFCGNMGLMAHHVKVHSPDYDPQRIYSNKKLVKKQSKLFTDTASIGADLSSESAFRIAYNEKTKRHSLQGSNIKKYCCEKCPFSSAKRDQYERHTLLHSSKQKYVCPFCDYSVPTHNLLLQHKRLHLEPNRNLLASQSINNLQDLPPVSADVAMTSGLTSDNQGHLVPDTHDHLNMMENQHETDGVTPKKLYRCDRCPYTNISREHLLAHLKSHVIRNEFECPYCDYSVSKVQLLAQHVNIHFADHTLDADRDLPLPLHATSAELDEIKTSEPEFIDLSEYSKVLKVNAGPTNLNKDGSTGQVDASQFRSILSKPPQDAVKAAGLMEGKTMWICQFCDHTFNTSEHLIKHEMQHLIGNRLDKRS